MLLANGLVGTFPARELARELARSAAMCSSESARARRSRWEEEQPWWFVSEDFKSRISEKMLAAIKEAPPEEPEPATESAAPLQTIVEMLIAWGDTVSDLIVLEMLLRTDSSYAAPMLAMLIFANTCQAVGSWQEHQSAGSTCAALLGFKPIVDGFVVLLSIGGTGAQFGNRRKFDKSRAREAATEAIPQAILQATALAKTGADSSTSLYFSIVWSIANITYTFTSVSFGMETNERYRTVEPKLCVHHFEHLLLYEL